MEHETLVKKMKTFLEVEGRMGPIPKPASSQYRLPQPDTNPNVRKDKATEKRKRVAPTKAQSTKSSEAATHPPTTISRASTNVKPQVQEEASENRLPPLEDAPVCESTPLPSAGKIQEISLKREKTGYFLPII